jgi:hypothetical protein
MIPGHRDGTCRVIEIGRHIVGCVGKKSRVIVGYETLYGTGWVVSPKHLALLNQEGAMLLPR